MLEMANVYGSANMTTRQEYENGNMDEEGTPRWPRPAFLLRCLHNGWLIAMFIGAVVQLILLEGLRRDVLMATLLPPFVAAWYAGRIDVSKTTRFLARSFLVILAVGIELALFPHVLPRMNKFPQLPLQHSRILTWYCLLYLLYVGMIFPAAYGIKAVVHRLRREPLGFEPELLGYLGLAASIYLTPHIIGKTLEILGLQ